MRQSDDYDKVDVVAIQREKCIILVEQGMKRI